MTQPFPTYLTPSQVAHLWGCSRQWVARLCAHGRVPGALKVGPVWLIPVETQRPDDARSEKK